MMQRGLWICDGCERPVMDAEVVQLTIPSIPASKSPTFTFAFCKRCNTPDVHTTVINEATRRWKDSQNK